MTGYETGRRVEWAVIHRLTEDGYECTRGASSKGSADVIAAKPGQLLFISCKRTNPLLPPAERADLLRVAGYIPGALALVAIKPMRMPLSFRRLTGPGPKEWEPWEPDEVMAS